MSEPLDVSSVFDDGRISHMSGLKPDEPIYDEAARIPEDHFVEKLREDNDG